MNPVMYILLNKSLNMSTGKAAAQAGHAAVQAFRASDPNSNALRVWDKGGHYAKVVLQTYSIETAERYINDRGFKTALIIDEGRTELDGLQRTAIGVEVLDKDNPHVAATFGEFDLYKDERPKVRKLAPHEKIAQAALDVELINILPTAYGADSIFKHPTLW